MSHLDRSPIAALAVALLAWFASGCAPAQPTAPPKATAASGDEHDHGHDHGAHDHGDHDRPETLTEAIAELGAAIDEVAAHLASGATDAADGAIHAAGHLIDDLNGFIDRRQELSAEARAAGKKALDELFECFDKLDTAMHAGAEEAKESVADVHESVKERIGKALTTLKDAFAKEDQ